MDDTDARQLRPVNFDRVRITGGLWAERQRVNSEITLPIQYQQCKETGRIDAFRLDWTPENDEPEPHVFWDSDVAKWIEAAACSLTTHPDQELEDKVDEVIDLIVGAQQPDGYLNVHFNAVEPEKRWTNLRDRHELYCAGHLIEAAVAYADATGKRKLLDAMCRYADYIGDVFGPGPDQKRGYPGHEEIELALVKLYRTTDEARYLKLAKFFVDQRGQKPHYYDIEAKRRGEEPSTARRTYEYNQSHRPLREQPDAVGHAVRAMYLYSGAADVAAETGDEELIDALKTLWRSVTKRRMYVTGGIGSTARNEGFTDDFDLPNESAYGETCAAIGLVFFASRMLQLEARSEYADVMERCIYNGIISGVSLGGDRFFYENPLASKGEHHRQEWFGCACCPPNLARFVASLGGYAFSTAPGTIYAHLFLESSVDIELDGEPLQLSTKTDYPWDGKVSFTVELDAPRRFTLAVRLPGWCREAALAVNGSEQDITESSHDGYAHLDRKWHNGDEVELLLPMPVERIEARPEVQNDAGRVALQRGPIIYCLEEADNGVFLNHLVLQRSGDAATKDGESVLAGMQLLELEGFRRASSGWDDALYRRRSSQYAPTRITAIPYFAWDNREDGEMMVWIRETTGITSADSE